MSEKSHVGMGYALCPVCGKKHDETVLLQTRMGLPPKLNRENFTGWALCPEDKAKRDEGYVAMVVVTNQDQPTLENANRTGEVLHIRASVWPRIFNVPVPSEGLAFIDTEAAAKIKAMVGES